MPAAVAVVTLVLRLVVGATGPTDWDSAQYAAAVGHFDVTHGEPQPPGYWLYVQSGRWLHQVFGLGTIHSLVLVAALASALAAGLTAWAGRDLGGRWVGLAAGLVIAASPFAWFSGSIVATYSFDMVAASLLIILAWRARPGSWHGVAAVVALGFLAGFRPSMGQELALLALIPVVGSTRTWGRLVVTLTAGAASVGLWLVPLAIEQPGGVSTWIQATRIETIGAERSTSVLDHAAGGPGNLGTFAAYTVLALGPLALLTLVAVLALVVRRGVARHRGGPDRRPSVGRAGPGWDGPGRRPWYQWRAAILTAAIVPPMLVVSLIEFAKGGYLLAYLPGAVIALLLPLGALNRRSARSGRGASLWLALTSVGIVLVVALGAQRFISGDGVLPARFLESSGWLWLDQSRYQAPYTDTRSAIRTADATDAALRALTPLLRSRTDVVLFDAVDGGPDIYRNAGWEQPDVRIAMVAPGQVAYNQLHGALYYASGDTVPVRPGGTVLLVASPALPGLSGLIATGQAQAVRTPLPITGFQVWRILPGTSILGVRTVTSTVPPDLGTGI
jgi:4-amino-4-deoxy-L-arabinose transferase-like glycosyltransferase